MVTAFPAGDVWVRLSGEPLSLAAAASWVEHPGCGAVVVFAGCVRDHAEGRPGVSELEYEAYPEQVEGKLAEIAEAARRRWPPLGRVLMWHRTGSLRVTECSVVVAVSAPHREEAFEASRFCIDALKTSVPIWKRERWDGGEDWGLDAHGIAEVGG